MLDNRISAGSVSSPSESKLVLDIISEGDALAFDGLRLRMAAASQEPSLAGMPLNKDQGIELKNLVLRVPEGITLDLGNGNDGE